MKRSSKRELDTGLNQDHKEKSLSAMSKPKKTRSESVKEEISPLTSGSEISQNAKKTSLSENENVNGSQTILQKKPKSLMPVPKLPPQEKRAELALKKLKVKPEILATAPQITPLLKTSVKGGLKAALDAMRFATDDHEINSFLKVYDKIPVGDRPRVPWEAVAIAAKVNPKHLLGAIQLAVQTHCWNRSRFIAISNHPDVMDKRVEYAKMAGGERDRTQLDISLGFLQSPKGPTFVGKQVAVYNAGGGVSKDDDGEEIPKTQLVYQGGDVEDRVFGTAQSNEDLDNKLVRIRDRRLEGL